MRKSLFVSGLLLLLASCSGNEQNFLSDTDDSPKYLEIRDSIIVSVSPFDSSRDTLKVDGSFSSIICMSSGYAAAFSELSSPECVTGVSGLKYISDELIAANARDVGYDAALDYELILSLKPDVLLAYGLSSSEPLYADKLRKMGVRVFFLYDFMENSPLARAEYLRAYGRMIGKAETADSLFLKISESYNRLKQDSALQEEDNFVRRKVLINSPYGDAWYVPGRDSYMYRLVYDAGGEILGAKSGASSSIITIEQAFDLSRDADVWLNPGPAQRPSVIKLEHIYDNTLRVNSAGGNDFWESGVYHPDLILSDLINIFSSLDGIKTNLNYFRRLSQPKK